MIYEVTEENNQKSLNPLAGKTSTGIPLGTWASFENDSAPNGEWLEAGTTFDPNTYPALAMYLQDIKVPERFDHNRLGEVEVIESYSVSGSINFIAPYDGILYFSFNTGTINIKINDVFVVTESNSGTRDNSTLNIKKGDVITSDVSVSNYALTARYYKHPLFIKATPTSSNSDYEGTLNAVRQYVTNSNSYSTDEVWTGGYWIDGKKIYRKVIEFASPVSIYQQWGNLLTTENVNQVISASVMEYRSGEKWVVPCIGRYINGIIQGQSNNGGLYSTSAILEYTKTTE